MLFFFDELFRAIEHRLIVLDYLHFAFCNSTQQFRRSEGGNSHPEGHVMK